MQGRFDLVYDGVNPPKMLEFNGDTPSLIIESGTLQEGWFKDTQASRQDLFQSNYVTEFLKRSMTKFSKQCDSASFVFMGEDDENVSQMKYLHKLYSEIKSDKTKLGFVPAVNLNYNDQCAASWVLESE
jgi:glutathionylspermidine synthase